MRRRIMAIVLVFAVLFSMVNPSIFGGSITVQAKETTLPTPGFVSGNTPPEDPNMPDYYNVVTAADLRLISNECEKGTERYLNADYLLWNDIVLTEEHNNEINIGTAKHYFSGTFDGQGHSITGLYSNGQVDVNKGLFGVMKNATIKNLVIKDAYIRSNHYGGILAAQVEDSIIQNVTIIDSECAIDSLGSVVGLITTGGLYGGALVGYAGNTKIYNCESRNTQVYIDTTAGIQAIGGDGMYMGGLIGWMEKGSTLEYSRVIGGDNGKVESHYKLVAGAASGNTLYAGGIVGYLKGDETGTPSVILDCFSDTYVNYNAATYISVVSGMIGYAAGIAARISGDNYQIERCHYAGKLSGHLYNAIGVFPIIEEDKYLAGIAGNVSNSNNIKNCFFDWEKAIIDNDYPGGPKVPAIYGKSNRDNVTTIGDSNYNNPTFFLEFDFNGTQLRSTGNNELFVTSANPTGIHYNKWVIDETSNMPIHDQEMIIEPVTVYSNINNNSFIIPMITENDSLTFPDAEILPKDMLDNLPKGINNKVIEAQFVGYSLVFIVNSQDGTEVSRVSDALYAPGDTIDADEITAYTGVEDEKHQIARIYAVWAQVQTIPEGSMYFGGGTPSFDNGLFSAVAVNTDILTRAGLQTGDECSYDRSIKYTLGKNTPIVTTAPKNVWDNELYKSYFDNSFESDSWDIYTSVLYNLSKSLYSKEINISPSLKFTYENEETKLIEGETVKYSHQNVALELLERLEAGKEGYTWENYEDELAEYAGK